MDIWLLNRLNEVINFTTKDLENYQIPKALRNIEDLISDISRWYIRRSRSRFQGEASKNDTQEASSTLHQALLTVSKLIAPFSPFYSDYLFSSLNKFSKEKKSPESVHLSSWPKSPSSVNKKLLSDMDLIKKWSSLGLAERSSLGLKIRQPLSEIKIKSDIKIDSALLEILKDEVNVKKVSFIKSLPDKKEVIFDSKITPELKEEGLVREFIRLIQSLRGKANLKPGQPVNLYLEKVPQNLEKIILSNQKIISSACSLKKIYSSKINAPRIKETSPFESFSEVTISLK